MNPVVQILEEVARYGWHIALGESSGLILRRGPKPMPQRVRMAVSEQREQIAAYLLSQEQLAWLRTWQPPEGSWLQ